MNLTPLDTLLNDHFKWHSSYQIDHFIVGRQLTPYGAYKQALRELLSRAKCLKQEQVEYERCQLDLEEIAQELKPRWYRRVNGAKGRRLELDAKEKVQEIGARKFALAHRRRELVRFWAHASVLKQLVGAIDEDRRYLLERDMWISSLRLTFLIDMFRDNRPSRNTIEALITLPMEDRQQVMQIRDSVHDLDSVAKALGDQHDKMRALLPEDFQEKCEEIERSIKADDIIKEIEACQLLSLPTGQAS